MAESEDGSESARVASVRIAVIEVQIGIGMHVIPITTSQDGCVCCGSDWKAVEMLVRSFGRSYRA